MRYPGRIDVMLAELAPGTAIAGVFTRSATRSARCSGARPSCALKCRRRRRCRDPRQFRQLPTPSPARAGRAAVDARHRRRWPRRSACPAARVFSSSTGVIGEPLPAERITAALGDLRRRPRRRRGIADGRPGDHDHRHLPQGRRGRGRGRRRPDPHRRHRQGLGHDRARHGDDAGLSSSPTRRSRAGLLQKMVSRQVDDDLQLHHRRQRHLDLGHAAPRRHRPGAGGRRSPTAADPRPRPSRRRCAA